MGYVTSLSFDTGSGCCHVGPIAPACDQESGEARLEESDASQLHTPLFC